MDPQVPSTDNIGEMKRPGEMVVGNPQNVKKFTPLVLLVVLVAAGIGIWYMFNRNKDTETTKTTTKTNGALADPLPTPTGDLSQIAPWQHSEQQLASEPPLPSADSLHTIYSQLREASSTRNLTTLKTLVSSERIWHIENPKRLIGSLSEGGDLYELVGQGGEENILHVPYSIIYDAPPQNQVQPVSVTKLEPDEDRTDFILVNPKTGAKEVVRLSEWPYIVELLYKTRAGYPDQGEGEVTFVYDKGSWVFHGQDWDLNYVSTVESKGDLVNAGANIVNVVVSPEGVCSPSSIAVPEGGAVRWNPITGMIYTVNPSETYWDSGYLHNDTYTKVFTEAGRYTFVVQQPPRDPSTVSSCVINVQ